MLKGAESATFLKVTESIIKLVKIFNKDRQCMVRVPLQELELRPVRRFGERLQL